MTTTAIGSRQLIEEYFSALNGNPKTAALLDQYVNDRALKEHIFEAEAAFPEYVLDVHQIVSEGDIVAVRASFNGTHRHPFAGVPATGKTVSVPLMIFYRVAEGRIQEHWMQMDSQSLMSQLSGK
jgi:steroid delta-isomerase-like uncharacterized protein